MPIIFSILSSQESRCSKPPDTTTRLVVMAAVAGPHRNRRRLGYSRLRRWVYGMDEEPDDFICRGCIYALTD